MSPPGTGSAGINGTPQVVVVTNIPSPYQVELFNAIADQNALELKTVYVSSQNNTRPWPTLALRHATCFLEHGATHQA